MTGKEHFQSLAVLTVVFLLKIKLMAIDVLDINWSLLEAEISNSRCDGNGCHGHGHIANIPHLLDLHGNWFHAPGRPPAPAPGSGSR